MLVFVRKVKIFREILTLSELIFLVLLMCRKLCLRNRSHFLLQQGCFCKINANKQGLSTLTVSFYFSTADDGIR